jgi:hypothetical protein
MPAKLRAPKQLRPTFSPEALRLFCELEKVKPRKRFQDGRTRRLAELLNLMDEFWTVNYVNDVASPCHPPHYQATRDWAVCRQVRRQLLEAAGLIKKSPARAKRGAKAEDEDAQPSHKVASDATPRPN